MRKKCKRSKEHTIKILNYNKPIIAPNLPLIKTSWKKTFSFRGGPSPYSKVYKCKVPTWLYKLIDQAYIAGLFEGKKIVQKGICQFLDIPS